MWQGAPVLLCRGVEGDYFWYSVHRYRDNNNSLLSTSFFPCFTDEENLEVLTPKGSKWKSDMAGALVYFTYSGPLFHILPHVARLFSSRVQEATLFHFDRKLFPRISIFGCEI